MTSFGPAPDQLSLLERLVAARLVVLGRVRGVVDLRPDPDAADRQEFAVLEVELLRPLRGEVPEHFLVRVAQRTGKEGEDGGWRVPTGEGEELLLVLAPDEDGDPPRYGVQHGSGFRVRDDVLELPDGVDAGFLRPAEDEPVTLSALAKLLARLDDEAAERFEQLRAIEGDAIYAVEHPEVQEMPSGEEVERADAELSPGPRDARPGGRWDRER